MAKQINFIHKALILNAIKNNIPLFSKLPAY
nr:MAG TPA: hypothetical protein [Caudoviricetes sp.]